MHMRILKSRLYYFVIILILAVIVLLIPKTLQKNSGKVRSVIDGDTIELYDGRIVHYIGVDAPRINVQQEDKWIFFPEPFALEARAFNAKLVLNKTVRLEFGTQKKDRFGRLLAFCFVKPEQKKEAQDVFVNKAIIEEGLGYAVVDLANINYIDDFFKAQKKAQLDNKNIWEEEKAISPKKAHNFINERKIIEGKVVDVVFTRRSITLLFHRRRKSYPKVVIFKQSLGCFSGFNIDPTKCYIGKKIRVFGFIREYSGPEIVVMHPLQIEIID